MPTNAKCGHRGCGTDTQPRQVICENTILSFQTAAKYGAEFIEFDTHVTQDLVPVIIFTLEIPPNFFTP